MKTDQVSDAGGREMPGETPKNINDKIFARRCGVAGRGSAGSTGLGEHSDNFLAKYI